MLSSGQVCSLKRSLQCLFALVSHSCKPWAGKASRLPGYGKRAENGSGPPVGKVPSGMPPPVDPPLGVEGAKPVGPLGVVDCPLGVVDGPLGVVDGVDGPLVVEGPLGVVEGPLGVVKGVKKVDGPDGVGGAPPEGVGGLGGVGGVPPEGVGGLGGVPPPNPGGGVPPEAGGDGGPPAAWPQHPGHMPSAGA